MAASWLFLAAYTSSGLAGLIYEVTWTRLLTLHLGHTTAAASAVIAAFMGGLAIGSAGAGRTAARLTARNALYAYVVLEAVVLLSAAATPLLLAALTPILRWAYADGAAGPLFPVVRVVCCVIVLLVPAVALGATFPIAVRWYAATSGTADRAGGRVYAANTTGAAAGSIAAGFVLIPALGVSGATRVGIAASALSIMLALGILRFWRSEPTVGSVTSASAAHGDGTQASRKRPSRRGVQQSPTREPDRLWLAAAIVMLTGAATFIYEVAWTRTFAMILGPSTYAFAATLATFITGIALGSIVGAALAARTRRLALAAAAALTVGAAAAIWALSVAGGPLPRDIARELASSPSGAGDGIVRNSLAVARLIAPTAIALGVAFPLALSLAARTARDAIAARLAAVYALNTAASVAGALVAGFILIPAAGLEQTIRIATALLLAGASVAIATGARGMARVAGALPIAGALWLLVAGTLWDRELLASGGYKYARQVRPGTEVEAMLEAGTLLYYREGAAATVSVRRLTGELSMAIDGKVDASNAGDMLTQKLLAHLPLLLHQEPRTVAIVGLGSGVTLASALVHPVNAVDVVEISPEVVEASRLFADDNRQALADPRARLIVGDGRSHLALSTRQYDVIISEPSNPWIAGVAALFTEEFLEAVRDRLAPGGIICQWAHTYDISESDLQSIVSTFTSVFPHGTMWLVGGGDLLLVGAAEPLDARLDDVERAWVRPGVAADLKLASVMEPFGVLSLFAGGPDLLRRFAAGAPTQIDDRMALEFTAPRAVNATGAEEILHRLRALADPAARPPAIARAMTQAGGSAWRDRAAMMLRAEAYEAAYEDYATALRFEPADRPALDGLVRASVAARREMDALRRLEQIIAAHPSAAAPRIALSRLRAATGELDAAVSAAVQASALTPVAPESLEQLASLYAEAGDAARLAPVAGRLEALFPGRPATAYYQAALRFLTGDLPAAVRFAREAIDRDAGYASAHNLLGAVHASLGDTDAARRAFGDARRLNPSDATVYANLGLLELSSGNAAVARQLFAEALSLDPASAMAREGLARTSLAEN